MCAVQFPTAITGEQKMWLLVNGNDGATQTGPDLPAHFTYQGNINVSRCALDTLHQPLVRSMLTPQRTSTPQDLGRPAEQARGPAEGELQGLPDCVEELHCDRHCLRRRGGCGLAGRCAGGGGGSRAKGSRRSLGCAGDGFVRFGGVDSRWCCAVCLGNEGALPSRAIRAVNGLS